MKWIAQLIVRFIPLKARLVCVIARKQRGIPYVLGGDTPQEGFDCSGLAVYCFGKVGKRLKRTSQEQWAEGDPILLPAIREADILFFVGEGGPAPAHEGIYLGSGLFIEAPHTGTDVRISHLDGYPGYMGARRYIR